MMGENICKDKLIVTYPASWWKNMWREALPSGNGVIGAAVYGGIKDETILINHGDLWHLGKKANVPDVSHTLKETRKLMREKKYLDASWHLTNTLKEKGYRTRLASRVPVGALNISMPCDLPFQNYQRTLDMETGEVTVTWDEGDQSFSRKLFVSRKDHLIAYEISTSEGFVEGDISLSLQKSAGKKLSESYPHLTEKLESHPEGKYYFYATENDDETDFGAVLRIIPTGGDITHENNALHFAKSKKVLVLIKVFIKGDRKEEWNLLRKELEAVDKDYQQLLDRHTKIHRSLYHSASIDLAGEEASFSNEELLLKAYRGKAPTSLIEKLWRYGRYLFISGTSPESNPFGLYGLWYGDYRLMWGHNMANENIQMMYWHAPVGGLIDFVPALFKYYEDMMDDFRNNAKKLYGCRGIFIPAGTTPGIGVPNQIVPVIMNWTGAAGWLAKHFYDYYLYTNDTSFLKNKALPFLREAAQFYEDFLVTGEDGYYRFYPSVSPENTPENFMPKDGKQLAHPMPTTINATVDFAIMKELFSNLVEGSLEVGENLAEIEKWKKMLRMIPDYQINEEGAIREWMHPAFDDRYDHRHLSHIYPIFPGQEFTKEEQPELFKAFENAVKKRLIGAQTGWSLVHMASIYARLENGNKALECLDILSRSCLLNNFLTLHNDWRDMGICMQSGTAPIQLDANLGFINAVQEMLLYVSPTFLKFLPALPDRWNVGSMRNMRLQTGIVSLKWDKNSGKFAASIRAERKTNLTIKLPEFLKEYQLSGDLIEYQQSDLGKSYLNIQMEKGQTTFIKSNEQI